MNLIFDHIENAYHSLRRNRGRTLLTTLGITIGIASVTSILAISGGVSNIIGQQLDTYGGRLAIIRPGVQTRDPNALTNPVAQHSFSTSTLTEADVQAINGMEGVAAVAPLMTLDGTLKSATATVKDNAVLATTADFAKTAKVEMQSGQFLDEKTDNNTAVIGQELSLELFDTDRPIGQQFTMRGQQFTVIGVVKKTSNPINYNNIDLGRAVVISFERGKLFHQGRSQIQQVNILAHDAGKMPTITAAIHKKILEQHLGEEDFTITSGKAIATPTNKLFTAVADVMTAIAAISLVVGGIGIMNIMLVGVAERTREIGIRKAVGASHRTIVTQFLMESLILSLVGGILGCFVGYLAAFIVSTMLYFTPVFNAMTIATSLGMALLVGVVFGIYPALKAARKDTIESLRQYH